MFISFFGGFELVGLLDLFRSLLILLIVLLLIALLILIPLLLILLILLIAFLIPLLVQIPPLVQVPPLVLIPLLLILLALLVLLLVLVLLAVAVQQLGLVLLVAAVQELKRGQGCEDLRAVVRQPLDRVVLEVQPRAVAQGLKGPDLLQPAYVAVGQLQPLQAGQPLQVLQLVPDLVVVHLQRAELGQHWEVLERHQPAEAQTQGLDPRQPFDRRLQLRRYFSDCLLIKR
jgi:hypothetical protein